MGWLEKIWILIGSLIIFIILSTDPKNSITGTQRNQALFASASDGQKFIQRLNWLLIITFFLTLLSEM